MLLVKQSKISFLIFNLTYGFYFVRLPNNLLQLLILLFHYRKIKKFCHSTVFYLPLFICGWLISEREHKILNLTALFIYILILQRHI